MKYFAFLLLFVFGCSSPKQEPAATNAEPSSSHQEVTLTAEQLRSMKITLGKPASRSISGSVKVSGMLDVPPQNLVTISAPLGGFVKSTQLLQGMRVQKGQPIVVMEHPDYIQLQQDYLETKSQLEFQEQEYKRQQDLSRENVNALKSLQSAKSSYLSLRAKLEGLKAKLRLVNIDPAEIETGEIKPTVTITSPITGFVSQVHVNLGMHVNPTDVMFKIVDTEHVHAEAQVYEKDIALLKVGQLVHIVLSNESRERLAKVYLIGKEISEDRIVRVHCHFEGEDENLIPGTFFSASIDTGTEMADALPQSAIVRFEARDFVFVETDDTHLHYRMIEIAASPVDNGYVPFKFKEPITNELREKIVITGAFDLLNTLKNTEL